MEEFLNGEGESISMDLMRDYRQSFSNVWVRLEEWIWDVHHRNYHRVHHLRVFLYHRFWLEEKILIEKEWKDQYHCYVSFVLLFLFLQLLVVELGVFLVLVHLLFLFDQVLISMLDHYRTKICSEFDYSFYPKVNDSFSLILKQDDYQMSNYVVPRDDQDLDRISYFDYFHAVVVVDDVCLVSMVRWYLSREIHQYYYWMKDVVE